MHVEATQEMAGFYRSMGELDRKEKNMWTKRTNADPKAKDDVKFDVEGGFDCSLTCSAGNSRTRRLNSVRDTSAGKSGALPGPLVVVINAAAAYEHSASWRLSHIEEGKWQ